MLNYRRALREVVELLKGCRCAAGCSNRFMRRCCRVTNECGFRVLPDPRSEALDRWMRDRLADAVSPMSPENINEFRNELVIFANWCVRNRRLLVNPVNDVPKLDATANPGRKRRSMTEAELVKLLRIARWRPLAEFGRLTANKKPADDKAASEVTESKSKRRKWTYSPLTLADLEAAVDRARERLKGNPSFVAKLDRRGRERALIFKTLVLTGLRKGELSAVTVGHFEHNGPMPVIVMNSDQTKNRQRAEIPLRADLAEDLRKWLATLQSVTTGGQRRHRRANRSDVPTRRGRRSAARYAAVHRAEGIGSHPRPRLDCGRHPEARRTRTLN